jgi:hypothetical protein
LEPKRWKDASGGVSDGEAFPKDEETGKCIDYMVKSLWMSLLENQEKLFRDIEPSNEESVLKAFHGTQKQLLIMEKFGLFSNNEAFAASFAQRRLAAEQKTKGLM